MTLFINHTQDPNLFHHERVAATRIVTGTDYVYDAWLNHYMETCKRHGVDSEQPYTSGLEWPALHGRVPAFQCPE